MQEGTFYKLEGQAINSSLISQACWGYLGRATESESGDTGERFSQGVCISMQDRDYFYPATKDEYQTLTRNAVGVGVSAGQYYNTFLKGRAGSARVTEVKDAPEALRSVANQVAVVPQVTVPDPPAYGISTATNAVSTDTPWSAQRRVVLAVKDMDELRDVLDLLADNDLEHLLHRIDYV